MISGHQRIASSTHLRGRKLKKPLEDDFPVRVRGLCPDPFIPCAFSMCPLCSRHCAGHREFIYLEDTALRVEVLRA